mgnify:CR=1 FL=1|jgi:hypothetical protein|tara:strand:+ start:2436 stop:4028 length:1593 start_codon:yes stop_codon:yes gene_type:complete
MHKRLLNLFNGDLDQFITTSLTGEVDERGKKQAEYVTLQQKVTAKVWERHLEGKTRIGLRPEKDEKAKWGCIDVDPSTYKNYSSKKYIDIIKNYKLPLVPVRSKSGGLHLFLFLKDWAPVQQIRKKLDEWNNTFFMANEVFPMNKAVTMPYYNMNATIEYAFDDNSSPLMIGGFLDLAESKALTIQELYNLKTTAYEPETDWNQYPPCVQKLIQEPWHGNNRNNFLFNIMVLENKKSEGNIDNKTFQEVAVERNKACFATPMKISEAKNVAKSVKAKGYQYKCPPKHSELSPICNKDLCKLRKLGIGPQVPDMIDDFQNIAFTRDPKTIFYSFDYQDHRITVQPEDMKDEKSWRVRLLRYGIFWLTLPKAKGGLPAFELLLKELTNRAVENEKLKFTDTIEEEKYIILKAFFEETLEEDDFSKLKDGYVVLDSKTKICYFKKSTLENHLKKRKQVFNNTMDALHYLGCERHEYHEGEKNIWYVQMPDFVDHTNIKSTTTNTSKTTTELDDEFHTGKFRTKNSEKPLPEDN